MPKLNIQDKIANPEDQDHFDGDKFVLAIGTVKCVVFGHHLDSALENCVDWLEQHAPGVFADDEVRDAYNDKERELIELAMKSGCKREDLDKDAIREQADEYATVDTIYLDPGHYLHSWEVNLIAENPTREQLAEIFA